MEILKDFGFEPVFFTAQIVNFLILAFIFKKFLYKPLLKVMHDRQQQVAKGIEDAESARLALEDADSKKDEILKAATVEAEKIIEETKKSTDLMREEMLELAKKESQRIIDDARITAREEIEKGRNEARDIALDISKGILDKILSSMFTKEEKNKILTRNVKVLEEID